MLGDTPNDIPDIAVRIMFLNSNDKITSTSTGGVFML